MLFYEEDIVILISNSFFKTNSIQSANAYINKSKDSPKFL